MAIGFKILRTDSKPTVLWRRAITSMRKKRSASVLARCQDVSHPPSSAMVVLQRRSFFAPYTCFEIMFFFRNTKKKMFAEPNFKIRGHGKPLRGWNYYSLSAPWVPMLEKQNFPKTCFVCSSGRWMGSHSLFALLKCNVENSSKTSIRW